ncbi:MAG: GNAT family N-acetyltransferase [Pikeienuella sp.]
MTQTRSAIAIRPAAAADLDALIAVWAASARAAHPFLPGEGRGARRQMVRDHFLPRATTLLAEADGRILGFASVIEAELAGLFVLPEAQGQGIGRALLTAAAQGRASLTLTVFVRSARARAFYARAGFVEIARGLDGETSEPVIRMRRDSTPAGGSGRAMK